MAGSGDTGFWLFGRHRWPVTLHRDRVRLAPMRRRDQFAWEAARQVNQEWLRPWEATVPAGAEPGPATYVGLVRMLSRQAKDGRMLPWLVFYDDETGRPQLAGQLTVSGITGGSASWGQIGYWVDERLAGRGIIPLAVALATDYCFQVMRLHRIEIAIRPENAKSLRVVEKLGFRPEGHRTRYLHIDGDWRDHQIFVLNTEDVPGGLVARLESRRLA